MKYLKKNPNYITKDKIINEKKANSQKIKLYFLIIWIILNSGAWVIQRNNSILIFNSMCVFFAWAKIFILDRYPIKYDISNIVLIILITSIAFSLLVNNDLGAIITYIHLVMMLLLGYMVSIFIDFNEFKRIYINVILIVAIISLLLFTLHNEISFIAYKFPLIEGASASYRNMYIYLYPLFSPHRNTGIFWEPGAYQVFLNLALIFVLFSPEIKNKVIVSIILITTILTTSSTAGYLILLLIFIAYVFNKKSGPKSLALSFSFLIGTMLLITNKYVLNIFDKLRFLDTENKSSLLRWYSSLSDLYIIKTYSKQNIIFNYI